MPTTMEDESCISSRPRPRSLPTSGSTGVQARSSRSRSGKTAIPRRSVMWTRMVSAMCCVSLRREPSSSRAATPPSSRERRCGQEPLGGFPGIRGYFADADQDGQQEMWIVPNAPNQIEVWENRGDDTYVQVAVLAEPTLQPGTLAFGDFDGDGATEIVAGGALNNLFVWENTGDDSYSPGVDVRVSRPADAEPGRRPGSRRRWPVGVPGQRDGDRHLRSPGRSLRSQR